LDSQKKYKAAERLFEEAKNQTNWYNWQTDTQLGYFYALHLYDLGYATWMKRNPQEAYVLMKNAKKALKQYRGAMKGRADDSWQIQMDKIQQVIDFLEAAGFGKKSK